MRNDTRVDTGVLAAAGAAIIAAVLLDAPAFVAALLAAALVAYAVRLVRRIDSARRRAVEAEHRLHVDLALARSTVGDLPEPLIEVASDGRVARANRAAEDLLGAEPGSLEDLSLDTVFGPEDCTGIEDVVRRGGAFRADRARLAPGTGVDFPVAVSASELRAPDGSSAGAMILVHDVSTMSRRHDDELAQAKAQAEMRADAEVLAQQREVHQEAQAAAHSRAEFLGNMNHHVRVPLNGIIGLTGLLLDTQLDEEQRRYAHTVRSCGRSLSLFIESLVDLSECQAGRLELRNEEFDLSDLLDRALEELAPLAVAKNLELVALVDGAVPSSVLGDPIRVRQVLRHLVSNAIKFTDSGEVSVTVQVESLGPGVSVVNTVVRDTGIGIDESLHETVFQPFARPARAVGGGPGGSGLGLALCRALSELMGGGLSVESASGQGSTFRFDALMEKAPGDGGRPGLETGRGRRALCVDPNRTVLAALRSYLEEWGLEVESTSDAGQAITSLTAVSPPDVVLVDRRLAAADEDLVRFAEAAAVPLVLLGRAGGNENAAVPEGALLVPKPVSRRVLMSRLRTALSVSGTLHATAGELLETLDGTGRRILVVEDNPVNEMVARKLLEAMGFEVDQVPDGLSAVDAAARGGYAGILMDCRLPGIDGYEATRRIRALTGPEALVPVIALTADCLAGAQERCVAAGMDGYVTKPVRPSELVAALRVLPAASEGGIVNSSTTLFETLNEAILDELETLAGDGGDGFVTEIVQIYVDTAQDLLSRMQTALRDGDCDTLREAAHSLKGGSLNVGAVRLGRIASDVEHLAQGGDAEAAGQLCERVPAEVERVTTRLRSAGYAKDQ